jgi:hypothetical protein
MEPAEVKPAVQDAGWTDTREVREALADRSPELDPTDSPARPATGRAQCAVQHTPGGG